MNAQKKIIISRLLGSEPQVLVRATLDIQQHDIGKVTISGYLKTTSHRAETMDKTKLVGQMKKFVPRYAHNKEHVGWM